jgi:hypothetical protein
MTLTVTRLDLFTYAKNNGWESLDPVATRRFYRACDNGLRMVSREREWAFLTDTFQLVTIVPYSTGTLTTPTAGDTTWEFAGATIPTNVVTANAFLEVNGERGWYEITERTDADTLETRSVYMGSVAASTASTTFRIVYPCYDLPADFRSLRGIWDIKRQDWLREVEVSEMWWLHSEHAGASQPEGYAVKQKRHDPNVQQLIFWPAPGSTTDAFEIAYTREAGWYSSATPATSTFKMIGTATTDYVDWPEAKLDLLYRAIMVCYYEETGEPKLQGAERAYYMALDKNRADDKRSRVKRTLSDGGAGPSIPQSQWNIPTS